MPSARISARSPLDNDMDECEPCDTCRTGIAKFMCFDQLRRCKTCIAKLAKEFNGPPARPTKKRTGNEPDKAQQSLF